MGRGLRESVIFAVHLLGLEEQVTNGFVLFFQGEFPTRERLNAHVPMLGLFVHDDDAHIHHEVAHGDERDAGGDESEASFEPPKSSGP